MHMNEQLVFPNMRHALQKRKVEQAFSFRSHTKAEGEKPWPTWS